MDRRVVVSGRAVNRSSGAPMPDVQLSVVLTTNGFERPHTLFVDASGAFDFTFTPNASDSGEYFVSVVHPDVHDRPVMGSFTLQSLDVSPRDFTGALARNVTQQLALTATAGASTSLTNLRLEYLVGDQAGGVLPVGITVTSDAPRDVSAGEATQVNFQISGDDTAAVSGALKLRLVSDDFATPLAFIDVNFTLQDAQPALVHSPSFLEMGTARDKSVAGQIRLENKGLAALTNVALSLTLPGGVTPAPDWLFLTTSASYALLDVGASQSVGINAFPGVTVLQADYEFRLKVTSDNAPDRLIPLYVAVTQSGVGDALVHASDIYTATLDENNDVIPGLEGATIKLQNEQVLSELFELTTDQFGNALFEDIPAGRYVMRGTAPDHQPTTQRLTVQPGITLGEEIFLTNELVTVEWSVEEITIEDRYEIVIQATFKTNVPAAVVMLEPLSVNLPVLREGETFYGELTLTNYGLIRADNLLADVPSGDDYLQFEFMTSPPPQLLPGEIFTIPYRATALRDIDAGTDGDASGGGCASHSFNYGVFGNFLCAIGIPIGCGSTAQFSVSADVSSCGGPVPIVTGGLFGGGNFDTGGAGYGAGGSHRPLTPLPGGGGCQGGSGSGDCGGEGGSPQ